MNLPLGSEGSRVVIISVSTYQSDELPDVHSARRSADDLAELLQRNCEVRAENICIVRDPQTVDEIGSAVLAASESATDVLLIYFVGHGLVSDSGELYLAHGSTSSQRSRIPYTALRYMALRESLLASSARSMCVVLDCCFSGRATGVLSGADILDSARVDGACVIAAAARNERALAPTDSVYTAFTGELLSYLNCGSDSAGDYLTLRDVFQHLAVSLPAKGCPEPRIQSYRGIENLILCVNPAAVARRVDGNDSSRSDNVESNAIDLEPPRQPGNRNRGSYAMEDVRLGEILQYDGGWSDFNPLPQTIMDADGRVPRTVEHISELVDEQPPNWEARLFAATSLQELVRLRPSFALHFRGNVEWNGVQRSGQAAFSYIQEALGRIGEVVSRLGQVLSSRYHTQILESRDSASIEAYAFDVMSNVDKLIMISAELRSTSITNRHLRHAASLLAHFPDQSIVMVTTLVHKYVTELDESGLRIMHGESGNINVRVEIDIPDALTEQFSEAMARY